MPTALLPTLDELVDAARAARTAAGLPTPPADESIADRLVAILEGEER